MSNSVFSESAELPQENHKYTAQQIKQKILGGGIGNIPRVRNLAALEDAEADILEKKRVELQKELEKQLKMESQAKKSSKDILKKHKRMPRRSTTSDSSSSSSDSSSGRKNSSSDDDSSSSSSSSSRDSRKKMHKRNIKRRRDSSSSSDDHPPVKKKLTNRKHHQGKKSIVKAHTKKVASLKGHSSRAITPLSMGGKRSTSPLKASQKMQPKKSLIKEKHHGALLKERSRDTKDRELHREKDKIRMHSKDRVRSRSPVKSRGKSRSPRRDSREMKRKSHEKRLSPAKVRNVLRRDRSVDRVGKEPRRHEPSTLLKDRERRDKERADREAARNKERAEALARCQERQRERERLAKEKELSEREKTERGKHGDRLLPRPAERAMALAASRGESHEKVERDRPRSHGRTNVRGGEFSDRTSYDGRPPGGDRRYHDSPTLRRDRDERHVDRSREHEYMIVRNRPEGRMDARATIPYDGSSRRNTREDHDMYSDVPVEGRYEGHDERHMSHDYTPARGQYGAAQMHREHEWERGMDQGRDRMYDRQPDLVQSNRPPPMQNEWERNDMSGVSGAMNRTADPYAEGGEWKMNERQWEDPGVAKPVANWQGGMKDESWEGYQEREPWVDRHREVPEGGRRWPARRGGHQMMPSGDNEGRNEPYRRPLHGHPHISHMQGDHMNTMGGNPTGGFHHNQGIRHVQQSHAGPTEMMGGMGNKDYGNQMSVPTHYTMNQGAMQSPLKRPRMNEEGGMNAGPGAVDQNVSSLDTSARKMVKISNISEEAIEDNLSEISDDADDILNSVENTAEPKIAEHPEAGGVVDDRKILNEGPKSVQESLDESKDEGGEKVTMKEIQDDFNLGFEEISDGELEEEARVKGLGDALGVDWTSLVTESRARDQAKLCETTSVRQKWKHHQVLLNLGISTKMAGEEFTKALLQRARRAAREEAGGVDKIAEDSGSEVKDGGENEINQAEGETIAHHVADVQVAQKRANERRSRLISQAPGCFSRALNARRDLQIRRQLCGFPIQEVHYCSVNPELNSLAVQLFKKATASSLAI